MIRARGRSTRSGVAIPWVLAGMGLAGLLGVLAWNRAWSHRERAALVAAQWQAQLLAESALACAEDSAWSLLNAGTRARPAKDSAGGTALDGALGSGGLAASPDDSGAENCRLPPGVSGSFGFGLGAGSLLVPATSWGEVRFGDRAVRRAMRATLSGSLDKALFGAAVVQTPQAPVPLDVSGARVVGPVRVRAAGTAPSGMEALPAGVTVDAYVPARAVRDTLVLGNRMREAFRADDALQGGAAYSRGRGVPDRDEIVHVGAGVPVSVEIEGPPGGASWELPEGRVLIVEGDVTLRGAVRLRGWTVLASGGVLLDDRAELLDAVVYAAKGVRIRGEASASGQILSRSSLAVSERARLVGATVALCWGDSARILLDGSAASRGYLAALGSAGDLQVGRDAVLEGVAVSGGTLRVSGAVRGVSVSPAFRCGRGADECLGDGTFDRSRIPADFVVPVGLPGARGLRVAWWDGGGS